jgi:ethanolamine utilization protein EutN
VFAAKLIGNIWATRKAEDLTGYKLMLAEKITGKGEGELMIVVDIISAGIGERVIVTTGSSARKMLGKEDVPVDAVVVGIIDEDCMFQGSGRD